MKDAKPGARVALRSCGVALRSCGLGLALALCAGFWSGSASAQASKDDLARTHFESGAAYLQQSDLDGALREFENAYRLSPRPEILLNIATVYERMGKWSDAVSALERYLKDAPDGEHAGTVQVRIENLKKRLEESAAPPAAPPPAEQANQEQPPPPAKAEAAPPKQAEVAPATPNEAAQAGGGSLPAYLVLGGAGLAAVGAVVTGLMAKSEYDDLESSCKPNCTDDELGKSKNLALTSTILTAVAVVAGGVGATLLLTQPAAPEAGALGRPQIRIGFDTTSAKAHVGWRF